MSEQASTLAERPGRVIWITGLAGAGKSSVARELRERLIAAGRQPILLDGDELRTVLGPSIGYTPTERRELAHRYGKLCQALANQGFDVICATISMFHDVHAWNRSNLPGYCEVYLRVPATELARRNQKDLYSGSTSGPVVGVDAPAEEPLNPDLIVDNFGVETPNKAAAAIAELLKRGFLRDAE